MPGKRRRFNNGAIRDTFSRAVAVAILLSCATGALSQTTRVWKSDDGQYSLKAEILALEGDVAKLRKTDGEVISVPLDRLSEADQDYARNWSQRRQEIADAKAIAGYSADVLGEPVHVLKTVDIERDTVKGRWTFDGDALVTQGEVRSVLTIPHELPDQYQLKFVVHRFRGARGLNVAISVGGRSVMLVIDAWKGSSSGLTLIDDKNEQSNVTAFQKKVLSAQPAEVVCTIHRKHVHVTCDGKTIIEWYGDPSRFSLFQRYWAGTPANRITLGTWGSDFRFTNMTVTPIKQSTYDNIKIEKKKAGDPSHSVALIEHPRGSGSGFVASRNLLVTNHHVIAGAYVDELEIHFPDQEKPLPVRQVLFEEADRDLAILLVETDRLPLPIAFDGRYAEGDEIIAHGNPSVGGGIVLRNASVTGKIMADVRINGQDFFQVEAEVNPGSSGGPILNSAGQVAGVTAMKATEEGEQMIREGMRRLDDSFRDASQNEGVAFGIPSSALAQVLDQIRLQSAEAAGQTSIKHDTLVMAERLLSLFQIQMLKALASASESMQRQAALARSSGRTDDLVALLSTSLARQTLAELDGARVKEMVQLYTSDLDRRVDAVRTRSDVPQSIRQCLADLHAQTKAAERFASRLPGNYRAFSKKWLSLEDELMELLEKMKNSGL